jgi:mannosyltransferase OCH1-like enzyme
VIPKIFHRIWIGGDIPPIARDYGDSWPLHNPGWRIQTWREWSLPPLVNQRAFDEASHPAKQADIARLELLARYGGVYLDTDFEAVAPLGDLLDGVECFVAAEDAKFVGTAIIGARPHHPFIEHLVHRVSRSIADHPNEPPNRQTGPWFVTAQLEEYVAIRGERDAVSLFPPEQFYPYHFSEPEREHDHFPDAIAVHHRSGSWV